MQIIAYADDLTLISNTKRSLGRAVEKVQKKQKNSD